MLLWKYFVLSFSALLPLVNPLGSALIFLGLVGQRRSRLSLPRPPHRHQTVLFFAIITSRLRPPRFFGISLPIVQVAGGLVIAAIGWACSTRRTAALPPTRCRPPQSWNDSSLYRTLQEKVFYPFTFPITAGPGCIVVMLTLSCPHAAAHRNPDPARPRRLFCPPLCSACRLPVYACAPARQRISPSTAHGILRVIAFILLCIGVQIAWNGLSVLLASILNITH